jgi:hypothetical protein
VGLLEAFWEAQTEPIEQRELSAIGSGDAADA